MKLPNGDRAIVDRRKLRDYCLNVAHPEGRHKARVFRSALGITRDDADALAGLFLEMAASAEAIAGHADQFGSRHQIDALLRWRGKAAMVRTAWITRHGDSRPHLTSCYVLID